MFCGVYSSKEDDLSGSKGHRNTQLNLRERLTSIFGEIIVKTKESMRQSNNNNTLKTVSTAKHNKIGLKDTAKYG